ncbi:glutathione S-transferase family protein [Neomegalonema sp.]|uniref:glutathione S-transferase family protein n=1 Tax=Neomegalonema sp. TaxID=2039713 RepID=UPI00261F9C47|nr:glutathione S-transferase family protein [Neomegalonema sp.]MDD2868940.1 glutathione S-transferase family protein [Neomegalonema sp.]
MRKLYSFPLSAPCRKVRLALAEKRLTCDLIEERGWERRPDFLMLNPAAETPVLVEPDGLVAVDSAAILEHLEEAWPEIPLLPLDPAGRAEARRLAAWFDGKFAREVTAPLTHERLFKRLKGEGPPNSERLRIGSANLRHHLDYVGWLADRRRYLAGEALSFADLAGAAHLSCLDYLGAVPWSHNEAAKLWYMRIKSRPSFRSLLADALPGIPPQPRYADLDF